jgi:hypothetical protein
MLEEPLFLVSVQSKLAYLINENYYNGLHYAWCSPGFDCPKNPPDSNPKVIFSRWREDYLNQETDSLFIQKNRQGVKNGILHQFAQGYIPEKTCNHLINLTDTAAFKYFCPVLYVMPYQLVKHLIEDVDFDEKAGPFSIEFKIPELPKTFFNVFEI